MKAIYVLLFDVVASSSVRNAMTKQDGVRMIIPCEYVSQLAGFVARF